MNRPITTDLHNILDLIVCAEGYGFKDDVLFTAFRDMIHSLSDEEIETFSREMASKDGYGDEDYEHAVEQLNEFRDKYLETT